MWQVQVGRQSMNQIHAQVQRKVELDGGWHDAVKLHTLGRTQRLPFARRGRASCSLPWSPRHCARHCGAAQAARKQL